MPANGKLLDSASALPFSPRDDDVHLTRPEAGSYLRVSVATLERWAMLGEGPEVRRIGRRVVYPLSGLRRFASGGKTPPQAG